MLSALKRLTGRSDAGDGVSAGSSHRTMSANLQRKFARGVQYNMKVVIKGDRNVGKTCLFHRLQGKSFIEAYTPTDEIQVACIHWNYKATDDIVKVEVWDVVDRGKKKKTFDGLKLDNSQLEIPEEAALDAEFLDVYKGANGVILVMDITKSWTFDYIQRELPKVPEHIPIMILANHCDMAHHRTVTPHHLTFYVENLQRGSNAAEVRYGESSMRNGFGLKLLHKFFNLPFLQLQRDTLLRQLETNRSETELTIHELDLYLESEDADYNKFLDKLVDKRRAHAESASSVPLTTSQSSHQLQQQNSSAVQGVPEGDMKRSVSMSEYRIGPIGGGHPIPSGLHKTAIGVGNPHSKILGPNFSVTELISHPAGDSRVEHKTDIRTGARSVIPGGEPAPEKEQSLMSKIFGKSKDVVDGSKEIKEKQGDVVPSVEEFVPDEGCLDRSFLEDVGQEAVPGSNVEPESDSDGEFGNPLVSGFQDDLDPDDPSTDANPMLDSYPSAKTNLVPQTSTVVASVEPQKPDGRRDSLSSIENEISQFSNNNSQAAEITGDALDTWLSSDSKWRRSPEGGEDSHSDCTKAKDDVISVDSMAAHSSLLDESQGKKDKKKKKKKKEKENEEKPAKKTKKKTSIREKEMEKEKEREKEKEKESSEKRKKRNSKTHEELGDALERT